MMGLVPLQGENRELSPSHEDTGIRWLFARKKLSPGTNRIAQHLDLGLPASRTVRNNVCGLSH